MLSLPFMPIGAPKKPVVMDRELHAEKLKEFDLAKARKDVAESMARLFPYHSYTREDTEIHGKLAVVHYTYEFS
jgi:hypothetical protein